MSATSRSSFRRRVELAHANHHLPSSVGVPLGVFAADAASSRFDHVVRASASQPVIPVSCSACGAFLVFYVKLWLAPVPGIMDYWRNQAGASPSPACWCWISAISVTGNFVLGCARISPRAALGAGFYFFSSMAYIPS